MGNEKQVAATAERIRELRVLCEKYGLSGREAAERYTDEELSGKIYNGAGPDSWLPVARDLLTKVMVLFEPVVLIHDVQFHESDGTHEGFDTAVNDWKTNTARILAAEYPRWTWRQLSAAYRRERAKWLAIAAIANAAIAGKSAFRAWREAYLARKGTDE